MDITGKTGIVIHAGVAKGARTWGKIFDFVHLTWLVKVIARNPIMVIEVDGVERREAFYEPHFVECAPGEHDLLVWFGNRGPMPGSEAAAKAFSSKRLRVGVAAGEVCHVTYTPGGLGQVRLELGNIHDQ